jgi:hypothetical protein
MRELQAHDRRRETAEGEKDERRDDVATPDNLVVDTGEAADEAGRRAPGLGETRAQLRIA